ncbi:thioredoxin family protein [Mycoplasmatota bacterium]|nr:thioredoxin family protein [Mycoplasmatota bacterium]
MERSGKRFIILISVFLVLIIIAAILLKVTEDEKTVMMEKYTTLTTYDHVYDIETMEEFEEIVATGEKAFVYFGHPDCPACVAMVPHIDRLAKENEIEKVYYVEFHFMSDLAAEWGENGTYDYKGTPAVMLFDEGEFVKSYQSDDYSDGENLLVKLDAFFKDYV